MRRSTSLPGFQRGAGAPWRSGQSWRSQACRLREFDESISLVLVRLLWHSGFSRSKQPGCPGSNQSRKDTLHDNAIHDDRQAPPGARVVKTPSEEMLIAMGKYNKKMIKAGTLLDLAKLRLRMSWVDRSTES